MAEYTVILTDVEEKALSSCMVSVQDWIDNAIHNRARKAMGTLITEHTDKQPKKLDVAERNTIVQGLTFETAVEHRDKFEAEILAAK